MSKLQQLIKEQEEEFFHRIVKGHPPIPNGANDMEEADSWIEASPEDMWCFIQSYNAKIIKAVCEELTKRNRNEDGTIDYNVDTFIAGYNYRESLLFKVAKEIESEVKL